MHPRFVSRPRQLPNYHCVVGHDDCGMFPVRWWSLILRLDLALLLPVVVVVLAKRFLFRR